MKMAKTGTDVFYIDRDSPLSARDYKHLFETGKVLDIRRIAKKVGIIHLGLSKVELIANIKEILRRNKIQEPIKLPIKTRPRKTMSTNMNMLFGNNRTNNRTNNLTNNLTNNRTNNNNLTNNNLTNNNTNLPNYSTTRPHGFRPKINNPTLNTHPRRNMGALNLRRRRNMGALNLPRRRNMGALNTGVQPITTNANFFKDVEEKLEKLSDKI